MPGKARAVCGNRVSHSHFPLANKLNSTARQASAERCWSAIAKFFENCKKKIPGKKGFPRFKKNQRSVEYKKSGWSLSEDRKKIAYSDKNKIGTLKLIGTRDLHFYQIEQIQRVRLIKRLDGDENAAINILLKALKLMGYISNTVGHTEINACGETTLYLNLETVLRQGCSVIQESPSL